jgi:uncharacterized protein YjbI with pentapeptide repeats
MKNTQSELTIKEAKEALELLQNSEDNLRGADLKNADLTGVIIKRVR